MTRYLRLAGLTVLLGTLLAPAAHADTRFDVRIGVGGPPVVAYPPRPFVAYAPPPPVYGGYVWQPGYFVWTGYHRRWVPGAWIRPGYGYTRPIRVERRWSDHNWRR
jgi:hypothetical protein